MKTYKGLNEDFKCMGFQYKVGETYSKKTKPELCTDKGFHSCENPLDVLCYYPPTGRFAECEISGDTDKNEDKICSQRITIKSEINLLKLVKLGVEYIWSKVDKGKKQILLKDSSVASNSGYGSVASNSGGSSVASNSGYSSVASNSGDNSVAIVSSDQSIAFSSGFKAKAKGNKGCWLVLAERDDYDNIINVKSRKVDGKKIKANTFYFLVDNKFIEA